MIKKKMSVIYLLIILCVLTNCGKKDNQKLAQSYYKLALLELTKKDEPEKNISQIDYKRALCQINKAVDVEDKAEYVALKATILFKLHQEEEGFKHFQHALQLKTDPQVRAEILNNKACLLAHVGMKNGDDEKITESVAIWDELKNSKDYLSPEVALFNQSKVCMFKNDFEMAKDKLLQSVAMEPNFLDAHYYLSVVAHKLDDIVLTKEHLGIVAFLEPNHKGAQQLQDLMQK